MRRFIFLCNYAKLETIQILKSQNEFLIREGFHDENIVYWRCIWFTWTNDD